MKQLREYLINGWPDPIPKQWKGWYHKRDRLDVVANCVYLEDRIWIPTAYREKMLEELHKCHLGAVRMKMQATRDVYWPRMMAEIKNWARSCEVCVSSMKKKEPDVFSPWPKAKKPFERVRIDFSISREGHI